MEKHAERLSFGYTDTIVNVVKYSDGTMSYEPISSDREHNNDQYVNILTGSFEKYSDLEMLKSNIKQYGEAIYKGKQAVEFSQCSLEGFLAQREYLQIDGANIKDKLLLKKFEIDLLKCENKIIEKRKNGHQQQLLIHTRLSYGDFQQLFAIVNKQEKVRNDILARQNNKEQKRGKHAPQEDVITVGLEEPQKASENTVEKESNIDRRRDDPLYYHDLKADLDSTDKKTSKKPTLDGGMSL